MDFPTYGGWFLLIFQPPKIRKSKAQFFKDLKRVCDVNVPFFPKGLLYVHHLKIGWTNDVFFVHLFFKWSGWWFEIVFYVHPYLGKWSKFTNIFQMGWFNHQPVFFFAGGHEIRGSRRFPLLGGWIIPGRVRKWLEASPCSFRPRTRSLGEENDHHITIPYHPCKVYFPKFTIKINQM